jgi:hypothetical protein
MDENTWRIVQIAMWMLGIQTTLILSVFGAMWVHFSNRFDKIEQRFEKMEQRMHNFECRMVSIETTLHLKDCCILKENQRQKAE